MTTSDDRPDDFWTAPWTGLRAAQDGGQGGLPADPAPDAGPALTARIIADVTPLDEQFGAARKKSVPDALWPVLFGPLGPDGVGAASRPLPCYAILDAGRVPGLPDLLAASGLDHACLFRDEADASLQEAGPWIVELREDSGFVRNLFTRGHAPWHMWDRQPGIFLRSVASLDDLRRHFRKFIRLYSQRTKTWHYFRFYAPEIARTVIAAFDAGQFARFGAPLRLIACPARKAGFCVLTPRTGTGGA